MTAEPLLTDDPLTFHARVRFIPRRLAKHPKRVARAYRVVAAVFPATMLVMPTLVFIAQTRPVPLAAAIVLSLICLVLLLSCIGVVSARVFEVSDTYLLSVIGPGILIAGIGTLMPTAVYSSGEHAGDPVMNETVATVWTASFGFIASVVSSYYFSYLPSADQVEAGLRRYRSSAPNVKDSDESADNDTDLSPTAIVLSLLSLAALVALRARKESRARRAIERR